MLEALVAVLLVALFLFFLWWIATKLPFMSGVPLQVFGLVLAIIFVLYALQRTGILGRLPIRI